jgi:hypothetical protein
MYIFKTYFSKDIYIYTYNIAYVCIYIVLNMSILIFKIIKIEIMKTQYNYNVVLSGWIIINIIKLIGNFFSSKYQFY